MHIACLGTCRRATAAARGSRLVGGPGIDQRSVGVARLVEINDEGQGLVLHFDQGGRVFGCLGRGGGDGGDGLPRVAHDGVIRHAPATGRAARRCRAHAQ